MGVTGIELEAAVEMIVSHTKMVGEKEEVNIIDAGGRILAQDIIADMDQPPFPRSPLDGFALASQSVQGAGREGGIWLEVIATVYAGDYLTVEIPAGKAVKIMTGAPIPAGCDCVIRQEEVEYNDQQVMIFRELAAFENYCFAGEDYKKGALLLAEYEKIGFAETGILASAGLDKVSVFCRPRIAVFATGDELQSPGTILKPGKIYDSNLHMMRSRLQELGMAVPVAEQLPDDPETAAVRLWQVSAEVDAIITAGAVSVGEKDMFHQVLPMLGCERLFWRVNLKPGTPAMFAVLNETPMLHLSGNPFAALTTLELLGRPMLYQLIKDPAIPMRKMQVVLSKAFDKESAGRRFIRAYYDGTSVIVPEICKHASGVLSSMKGCNCLVDIPPETARLTAGEPVQIWRL